MSEGYDNTNRGTLGKNKRKELDTHPEYSGQINVAGVEYWLSGWVKTNGSTGEKFFSLSVKPKESRAPVKKPTDAVVETAFEPDSEIPFN